MPNMYKTLKYWTWTSVQHLKRHLCHKSVGFLQDQTQILEFLPAFKEGRLSLPPMPSVAAHSRSSAHCKRNPATNVTHSEGLRQTHGRLGKAGWTPRVIISTSKVLLIIYIFIFLLQDTVTQSELEPRKWKNMIGCSIIKQKCFLPVLWQKRWEIVIV